MVKNHPEEGDANEFTDMPIYSNVSSPGPSGSVTKHFQTTYVIPTQRQQVTIFYGFLKQNDLQLLELNANTTPILDLVNIPSSSKA